MTTAPALAAEALRPGDWIGRFTGVTVPAAQLHGVDKGYVKRVGPRYIDARAASFVAPALSLGELKGQTFGPTTHLDQLAILDLVTCIQWI